MARRRVWLFIVEGDTDETAIGLSLEGLVKSDTVAFDVFGSDIFGVSQQGRAGVDPVMRVRDINNRIRKEVSNHLERVDYSWDDLDKITLILDTDGSFVADEVVQENAQAERIRYNLNSIESANPQAVRRRNKERAHNVRRALAKACVTFRGRQVPVTIYFFSRNLEHALHDRQDTLSKRVKIRLSKEFRSRYKDNLAGFVEMVKGDLAVPGDYAGTWNYIQEGVHSLERGSNLHILLEDAGSI